ITWTSFVTSSTEDTSVKNSLTDSSLLRFNHTGKIADIHITYKNDTEHEHKIEYFIKNKVPNGAKIPSKAFPVFLNLTSFAG
ncbi:MAG: hypothetical protein P8O16_08555, partial [Algoriphagus sp.]|uniref:hypothetical protein n=1 Tax=Algoriphagus sp. TaxID=1872435 RepID=UPI00262D36A3